MVERLGNVLFWLGITISAIMLAMIAYAVANGATMGRDGGVLALFGGFALIPAAVGRALLYILAGR